MTASRSVKRRQANEEERPAPVAPGSAAPAQAILALQQSAGNAAVSAYLTAQAPMKRSLARVTQGQISDRAVGIWEEKGEPKDQTAEQQGADWGEATKQTEAMERETGRRAQAAWQARGGGASSEEQARQDWTEAEKGIAKDFIAERSDDWSKLLGRPALWTAGVTAGAPKTDLDAIKAKLMELWADIAYRSDLDNRLTLITESETLIDGWLAKHAAANGPKADQLMMLKMHTLAYERRRRLKSKKIADEFGIRIDGIKGLQAHKNAFTAPGNPADLQAIANLTGVSLFSLEELDMLITVFKRYAPLLGTGRLPGLGPQPLEYFSRNKVGLEPGADPKTDLPVKSPGDFGVTIGGDTISMYDKANRDLLDFGTKQQQFRGTVEHELSHALIEPLITAGGETMLQKFADDMAFWDGDIFASPYKQATDPATKAAAEADGAEAPPTSYGQTNAQEDLAETMMFFFEDPADLEARCPVRFRWVKANLGKYLGKEHMESLPMGPDPADAARGDAKSLLSGIFG